MNFLFVLFVCLAELIEELASARNLKIGMIGVQHDISTKDFEWLRKCLTYSLKKTLNNLLRIENIL